MGLPPQLAVACLLPPCRACQVEKFSHIEQADKDKVLAECKAVSAWLEGKLAEQDSKAKTDESLAKYAPKLGAILSQLHRSPEMQAYLEARAAAPTAAF